MSDEVSAHYSLGGLRDRIEEGLAAVDGPVTVASLGAFDEFHLGGRSATEHLVAQLELGNADRVLDVGSGLGGTARYIAAATGAEVTGVDLTLVYVEVATWLTSLVGLDAGVHFVHASADQLPESDELFTAATMVHVGMNIADKQAAFGSIAAQLESGARFAIYDLMVIGEGRPDYPMPWAATLATSALESADDYATHLVASGFVVETVEDRTDAALAVFAQMAAAAASQQGPAPLGLHLIMGSTTPAKLGNLAAAVRSGIIAPTEIIARKL